MFQRTAWLVEKPPLIRRPRVSDVKCLYEGKGGTQGRKTQEGRTEVFPHKGRKRLNFFLYKKDEQGYYRLKQVKKKTEMAISATKK